MTRKSSLSLLMGAAAGGVLSLAPSLAAAQQSPAQTAQQAANGGLEEVVVTAQKRQENVQEVPIAIEALNEHMLDSMQITTATDLGNFVPGLNISRANVASVPFLRGVGNFTATPGNEAAVATYVDDVYYPSPAGSTFSYNNLERVEVLKGPQGTLFGRNAAGGVINVVTEEPTSTPHIDFSVGYANYNTITSDFYGTTGIAPGLNADLSLHYQNQADGWGKNLFDGSPTYLSREWSGRSKWVYTPSDDWKFRFIADYDRTLNDELATLNILPGTKSIAGFSGAPGFYDTTQSFSLDGEQRQYGLSFRIDHDLGWANAASITSWRRSGGTGNQDSDDSGINLGWAHFNPKQQTSTQEFQLASPATSTVKMIGGVYLFSDNAAVDPLTQFGTSAATRPQTIQYVFSRQNTTSYAEYGQATAPVMADTNVTIGLRYTNDLRDVHGKFFNINGALFNETNQKGAWPKMTYRLALDHNFTPDILGYVSYNRGFKSGNFNVNSPTGAPVAPEVLDAYEAGVKADVLDHTVRLNAAAFYYQFNNLQVQESLSTGTVQLNAASAKYKGIDLDATMAPVKNLTIQTSLELLDPTYTNFPAAVFNFPCVTPTTAASCTVTFPPGGTKYSGGGYFTGPGNAAGKDVQYAERAAATVSANYRIPMDTGDISLAGSLAYHDGFFFDVQNTLRQPTYFLVDASAIWTAPSGMWDVKLWGKNITGEKYYAQMQVNATVADYAPEPPATYGVNVGYHWN